MEELKRPKCAPRRPRAWLEGERKKARPSPESPWLRLGIANEKLVVKDAAVPVPASASLAGALLKTAPALAAGTPSSRVRPTAPPRRKASPTRVRLRRVKEGKSMVRSCWSEMGSSNKNMARTRKRLDLGQEAMVSSPV